MPGIQTKAPAGLAAIFKKGAEALKARGSLDLGFDFTKPPVGINKEEGRARLTSIGIGEYKTGDNKGKRFLRMAAVVVAPHSVESTELDWDKGELKPRKPERKKASGLQTSQMFPLCPTKKADGTVISEEENSLKAMNAIGTLVPGKSGVGTEICDHIIDNCPTDEMVNAFLAQLVPTAEEIKKGRKPLYVKFSTSYGRNYSDKTKKPDWFENWHGIAEGYAPSVNGQMEDAVDETGGNTDASEPEAKTETLADKVEGSADAVDEPTLDELIERAKAPDSTDADFAAVHKIARECGVDPNAGVEGKQTKAYGEADWDQVKAWIEEKQAEAGGGVTEDVTEEVTEEPDDGPRAPKVGDADWKTTIKVKQVKKSKDKKGKVTETTSMVDKVVKVEVLAVDGDKCDVKRLDTSTVLKGRRLDSLEVDAG